MNISVPVLVLGDEHTLSKMHNDRFADSHSVTFGALLMEVAQETVLRGAKHNGLRNEVLGPYAGFHPSGTSTDVVCAET